MWNSFTIRRMTICGLALILPSIAGLNSRADEDEVRRLKIQVDKLSKDVSQLRAELAAIKEGLKVAAGIGAETAETKEVRQQRVLRELKELIAKVEKEGVPAFVSAVDGGLVKQRLAARKVRISDLRANTSLIAPFSADVTLESELLATEAFAARGDAEAAEFPGEGKVVHGYFHVTLHYREDAWDVRSVSQCAPNRTITGSYPDESFGRHPSPFAKRWYMAFGGVAE
jgi:hypothetical protein